MYERLYKFLEINEILHPLRFGFRKNHSTSHTSISMTEGTITRFDLSSRLIPAIKQDIESEV